MFVHNHLSLVSRNVFSDFFHLLSPSNCDALLIASTHPSSQLNTYLNQKSVLYKCLSLCGIDSVCLNCASLCPKAQLRSKYLACCGYGVVFERRLQEARIFKDAPCGCCSTTVIVPEEAGKDPVAASVVRIWPWARTIGEWWMRGNDQNMNVPIKLVIFLWLGMTAIHDWRHYCPYLCQSLWLLSSGCPLQNTII